MYKPFSDPENIQKALRQVVVFRQEQELSSTMTFKDDPFSGLSEPFYKWDKFVSNIVSKKRNPLEVYIYWDEKIENRFIENLCGRILNERSFLGKMEKYFFRTYKDFQKLSDSCFKRGPDFYKKLSNGQLAGLFERCILAIGPAIAGAYMPYYGVVALEKILQDKIGGMPDFLRKKTGQQEIFEILTMAGGETFIQAERKEFFEKLKIIQGLYRKRKNWNDKDIQAIVSRHWYDFGALIFNDKTKKNYSLEDYRNKFYKSLGLKAEKEIDKIKKEENGKNKKINRVFEKFKKDQKIFWLLKWFNKMMIYRNRDAEYYFVYFYHCQGLFDGIAGRLGIESEELFLLSKEEIVGGLKVKFNIKKIVKERKDKGFTIKGVGKSVKVLTGVKKEDWYEEECGKGFDFLSGSIACSGKVSGKVRIIVDVKQEGDKFKKGEILITSMTKSEFVPLMKKAAAIVTDEGGIVSHAAILARELKKPCITGTKIATKVLKNGDLVEVDAENGIVRILNKNINN